MIGRRSLGRVVIACLAARAGLARAGEPIGFAPASRPAQARAETKAMTVPTPSQARTWLRELTEEPHVAGTEADHRTAISVRDKLLSWGWQADLAEYQVLLNYPIAGSVKLEIIRPKARKLPIIEEPFVADKDSASPDAFPAFHGYGISGDVTGEVVYVNYGRNEDFAALEKLGVPVRDKIVLARYGELFRGLKVLNAQRRGARGILIYSDPADDGYAKGDTYPKGPYRPPSAIQRGSVQFLSLGPGDPSTPAGPSVEGAKRLPIDPFQGFPGDPKVNSVVGSSIFMFDKKTSRDIVDDWEQETGLVRNEAFPNIPSLPISYGSARPILAALGGPNVPQGWQGGLPLAYHVGPGPVEVHFQIGMDYKVRPIWNVIATIKGDVEPDRWVMVGNHRDAWVYGAVDPGSGTASTLEMCRALGAAAKEGWKPRRTLVYASWDAEEYGLVGSTEWAEDHAEEIDAKAVLMLNVDMAVAGSELGIDGVPSLRDLVLGAAEDVTDIRSGKSLHETWTARRRAQWANNASIDLDDQVWHGPTETRSTRAVANFSPRLNPLGSGSDYTAFVDHLGVPALDVNFVGHYGVYHSIYDDFFWMEKFGDPEFITHAMAAKLYTLIAIRAVSAEVVPFRFVPYGVAIREYVDDLRRMVERKARGAEAQAARRDSNFDGLPEIIRAVKALQDQAEALDRATAELANRDGVGPARLSRVNDALQRVERAFLNPDGLPGRPWFKHAIYAPGLTTGYASWPLPGVRQAILDDDPKMLAAQVSALVARLDAATEAMRVAKAAAGGDGK